MAMKTSLKLPLMGVAVSAAIFCAQGRASAFSITASYAGADSTFSMPSYAPNSAAASSAFLSAISGAVTESFEFSAGGPSTVSIFGGLGSLSLSSDAMVGSTYTNGSTYGGSGNALYGYPYQSPNAFATINFSSPVYAFGFWANEQNTVGDVWEFLVNDVAAFASQPVAPGGWGDHVSYYGIVTDSSNPINKISFYSSNNGGGYLVLDQATISTSPSGSTPVPAPLPVMGAIAAIGYSRKLRGRIANSVSIRNA